MIKRSIIITTFVLFVCSSQTLAALDRKEEIEKEMWETTDKDFHVTEVPDKWKNKSAVIIAKLHRFEYRKAVIVAMLQDKQYNHFRIKLLDNNAVNKYSELSYPANLPGNSATATGLRVYAGFKVIKPDGKEVIVDLKNAVKMEMSGPDGKAGYYKIAIPNLEPGDIIDYYICLENEQQIASPVVFFDPFIYNLPQEYPLMKQKLQFRIQRKCYINLRSLNGAPKLKMVVDQENDEQYYSLEDGDREGIADVKWLYSNRDVPTIKFRATFAGGAAIYRENTFLGLQGEVKSTVLPGEITKFANSIPLAYLSSKELTKYMKANFGSEKDHVVLSTEAYNYLRNDLLDVSQVRMLNDLGPYSYRERDFLSYFTSFLKTKKIPHDIVVCVRRDISSMEDVVLENELEFLVRMKKGEEYVYFTNPDIHRTAGSVPSLFQNTEAYALDGLLSPTKRVAKKITIPSTSAKDNHIGTEVTVKAGDLSLATMSVKKTYGGVSKLHAQHELLDVFDAIDEDKTKKYPEVQIDDLPINNRDVKKYEAAKASYLGDRDKKTLERAKESFQGEYEFALKDLTNFKVLQTGRYNESPEMSVTFDMSTDELIKKTGPNFLVDLGKLIEKQVAIEKDETERPFGIYFDYPRSFSHRIVFEIPVGYEVQGLEKFNIKVENDAGGFVSTAKQENGKVIIETHKHYDKYTLPKERWPSVLSFLNAAETLAGQKILLRKKAGGIGNAGQ